MNFYGDMDNLHVLHPMQDNRNDFIGWKAKIFTRDGVIYDHYVIDHFQGNLVYCVADAGVMCSYDFHDVISVSPQ